MFDELWSEIQDAPGEIFDHPNINEVEIFDSQTIINSIAKVKSPCEICLLYTSPSPRDVEESRMPSSA